MNIYYKSTKNKGLVLAITVFFSFFIISFILLIQTIFASKLEFQKNETIFINKFNETDFLDNILEQELKQIEILLNNNEIKSINQFFDSKKSRKIFQYKNFKDRISSSGYRIEDDAENTVYSETIKDKVKSNSKNEIDLNYVKIINLNKEKYQILATINYTVVFSGSRTSLTKEKVKRIEIKKYD